MKISAAESLIMDVLWRAASPLAVEDVAEALADESGWSEGTVRTLMTRLKKKKAVAAAKDGRRLFYRPLIERGDYVHAESVNLIDRLFEGRLAPFIAHFSDRQDLSDEEISELRALIERLDRGK
jgi:BlaI family transcriptional regulator, penicillinase repressor